MQAAAAEEASSLISASSAWDVAATGGPGTQIRTKIQDKVEEIFRHMGFPGCIGSMDVTHIFWDKVPEKLRFLCKGKEGKPSVAFQAVVE